MVESIYESVFTRFSKLTICDEILDTISGERIVKPYRSGQREGTSR